jgi:hypothetical protein
MEKLSCTRNVLRIQCTKSTFLEPEPTPLVKQVRPTSTKVNDLRTPIPILLQPGTLRTIIRIRYSRRTADDTAPAVRAEITLVADAHERFWADVRVADGAFSVAFLTETADGYAWLASAHY